MSTEKTHTDTKKQKPFPLPFHQAPLYKRTIPSSSKDHYSKKFTPVNPSVSFLPSCKITPQLSRPRSACLIINRNIKYQGLDEYWNCIPGVHNGEGGVYLHTKEPIPHSVDTKKLEETYPNLPLKFHEKDLQVTKGKKRRYKKRLLPTNEEAIAEKEVEEKVNADSRKSQRGHTPINEEAWLYKTPEYARKNAEEFDRNHSIQVSLEDAVSIWQDTTEWTARATQLESTRGV